MAVSQSDIDALNAALATGEKQVTLDNQTIIYRTVSDLILARNYMQEQLNRDNAIAANKRKPKRVGLYYSGRGYN